MLKLVKYEIRKSRTLVSVMIAVVAALEIYFALSLAANSETNIIASFSLFPLAGVFLALTVFIMGVSSYSRELSQKSSYLIFMTPNSALSVVASKMLFTLIAGLFFSAVLVALVILNAPLISARFSDWHGYYEMLNMVLGQAGLNLGSMLLTVLFFAALGFLQLLSFLGVAYLSVTLSATFLQNKKGKGIVSTVLFVAISYGLSRLSGLFIDENTVVETTREVMRMLVPTLVQNGIVVAVSLFFSAWMLERRVSL